MFAPGQAIESNLKLLAERRSDIFGVGQIPFFTFSIEVNVLIPLPHPGLVGTQSLL